MHHECETIKRIGLAIRNNFYEALFAFLEADSTADIICVVVYVGHDAREISGVVYVIQLEVGIQREMLLQWVCKQDNVDCSVQDYSISIANAMEILQSYTKPSMCNRVIAQSIFSKRLTIGTP